MWLPRAEFGTESHGTSGAMCNNRKAFKERELMNLGVHTQFRKKDLNSPFFSL